MEPMTFAPEILGLVPTKGPEATKGDALSVSVDDGVSARSGAAECRMGVEAAGWPHRTKRSGLRGPS